MRDEIEAIQTDLDPEETQEWKDALEAVIEREGPERAHFLIGALIDKARRSGAYLPYNATTAYLNTIPPHQEAQRPGDPAIERRIKSICRWNAMAMVVRANREGQNLGGHIATYQSIANLYEIGFNHFFHGPDAEGGGDLVFFQGHSSPGIYARAFLEGRLGEEQLVNFRQEAFKDGLSSYPHPWLMPDFWQFATVSMGLSPLMAIYQARFMKYLHNRGIIDGSKRKVWAFLGDGEMDEPESMGAISLAVREKLDNLIFVINCNLQRLDGPVRGNGKIIQELEADFRGAGWNVIKVIWGSNWDPLLARDRKGLLRQRMEEAVDGDYQTYAANDGAFVREHFFGKYPELREMVADMSDDDLWRLRRGGHDPQKVYAAFEAASEHSGQPTVILAKTIKGYGMGEAGEGQNPTHQQKKMGEEALRHFRDRFNIPISDEKLEELPFYKPAEDSPEMRYMKERREALGGFLPVRSLRAKPLDIPGLSAFDALLEGSGERELSTTMAFVRLLMTLTRDKKLAEHLVPIVADEARTFGMEGLFRQIGIYAPEGQLYRPVDADQLAYYREEKNGQILQEGITEAGGLASWIAAGTAYSNHGIYMIPFFIFYSMFGFQRVGDFIWAAADMQARGFLLGATSGRTTLNGEGLQHEDGHSQVLAANVPNCVAYDPTYAYELVVIMHDGLRRMYRDEERVFYYITLMNENYPQPAMPKGVESAILKGLYQLRSEEVGGRRKGASKTAAKGKAKPAASKVPRVQLMGSGTILREVEAAAGILARDFGVASDVWSAPSFNELKRDGEHTERWNRLHPNDPPKTSHVAHCLRGHDGPVIAASDYVRAFPEQIRPWVDRRFVTLGTDGFGRSDTRAALRSFFEVDRYHVVLAALDALAAEGALPKSKVGEAIGKFGLDPERADPWRV
ncbi:MAG TPA: pyruvate dehydrogenase (acetyl-transferring), homodimeric type [Thermoanaerobaculia bacterium]|nr:pyruvate dehydrogenase (acetyl-transferring), homodimeric type [Thermoanaerobaculia bacterium]